LSPALVQANLQHLLQPFPFYKRTIKNKSMQPARLF
jgi:hypothetical protein